MTSMAVMMKQPAEVKPKKACSEKIEQAFKQFESIVTSLDG